MRLLALDMLCSSCSSCDGLRLGQVWRAWQTLAPRAKQLYLYSDTDALIPPSEVQRCMALQAWAPLRCLSSEMLTAAVVYAPQRARASFDVPHHNQVAEPPCRRRGAWRCLPGCSWARRTLRTSGSTQRSTRLSWTASCKTRNRRRQLPDSKFVAKLRPDIATNMARHDSTVNRRAQL